MENLKESLKSKERHCIGLAEAAKHSLFYNQYSIIFVSTF
jgi:hypothetical protein